MRSLLIVLALVLGASVCGCSTRDPSIYDVKSPCVSNDMDGKAPCVRRKPVENDLA